MSKNKNYKNRFTFLLFQILGIFLLSLSGAVYSEEEPLPEAVVVEDQTLESMMKYEWRLVRDLNGIQVFMKHRDESKIKSFLTVMVMNAPDPYALAAVIEDFEAAPQWMHMISELTEITRHSNQRRDIRVETRLPWPVKDRDATLKALVSQNENLDMSIKMDPDAKLLPEYPGYIRMPEIGGEIRAQMLSGQRLSFEMEFLMDPGGYVPPWLGNVILKDYSYYTMKNLRKMLQKEEYQNKKSVYESWITVPDSYYSEDYYHPDEHQGRKSKIPVIQGTDFIPL